MSFVQLWCVNLYSGLECSRRGSKLHTSGRSFKYRIL